MRRAAVAERVRCAGAVQELLFEGAAGFVELRADDDLPVL